MDSPSLPDGGSRAASAVGGPAGPSPGRAGHGLVETHQGGANDTVDFPAGASSETVTVYINGDTRPEPDETFSVEWTSPNSSAEMGNNDGSTTTTITIKNDDKAPHGHNH